MYIHLYIYIHIYLIQWAKIFDRYVILYSGLIHMVIYLYLCFLEYWKVYLIIADSMKLITVYYMCFYLP